MSSKHTNVVRFGSNKHELGAEGVYGEVLSVGDKGVTMDPWVLHTGWLFLLNRWNHGDHLRRLIQCPEVDEPWVSILHQAVNATLTRCLSACQPSTFPAQLMQLVQSAGPMTDTLDASLNYFDTSSETVNSCIDIWTEFLTWLVRTRVMREELNDSWQLSEDQVRLLIQVERGNADEEGIIRLTVGLFEQRIPGWSFDSPLMAHMAISALGRKTSVLDGPGSTMPRVDRLLEVGQVVLLEHVVPVAERVVGSTFLTDFEDYHPRHLAAGTRSVFSELRRLRDLARVCVTMVGDIDPGSQNPTLDSSQAPTPSSPPSAASAPPGAQELIRIFSLFRQGRPDPVCPACWLLHGRQAPRHRFAECITTAVNVRDVEAFRRGIKWQVGSCHYACGAQGWSVNPIERPANTSIFYFRSCCWLTGNPHTYPSSDLARQAVRSTVRESMDRR